MDNCPRMLDLFSLNPRLQNLTLKKAILGYKAVERREGGGGVAAGGGGEAAGGGGEEDFKV
jgi:hypothetical protein